MTTKKNDDERGLMAEADVLLSELQRGWDQRAARIDALGAAHGTQALRPGVRASMSTRRLRMVRWAAVGVANVAVAAAVVVLLPRREGCDALLMAAGLLMAAAAGAVALLMAAPHWISLWRRAPGRRVAAPQARTLPMGVEHCAATFSAAAAVLLLFMLRSPVGDGRGISVHGMDRAAVVAHVDDYFNRYMS